MTPPSLVVVGVNHERAPVEVRERLAVGDAALGCLLADGGLSEALLLATCNRVEVWGAERTPGALAEPGAWLAAQAGMAPEALAGLLYCHRGLDAVAHMAAVAAGLDSMVVGEPQILGQVKRPTPRRRPTARWVRSSARRSAMPCGLPGASAPKLTSAGARSR